VLNKALEGMKQMTEEQVMERYGELPLKFSAYYKYRFTYEAVAPDGNLVIASIGGSADDIYRHEVRPDSTITLKTGGWSFAVVKNGPDELWCDTPW
jgi:hypothetical protein